MSSIALGRSKLRKEYVATPSLMPQGVCSTTADAGSTPAAARPAAPAAAPRKLRRLVWFVIGAPLATPILLWNRSGGDLACILLVSAQERPMAGKNTAVFGIYQSRSAVESAVE